MKCNSLNRSFPATVFSALNSGSDIQNWSTASNQNPKPLVRKLLSSGLQEVGKMSSAAAGTVKLTLQL